MVRGGRGLFGLAGRTRVVISTSLKVGLMTPSPLAQQEPTTPRGLFVEHGSEAPTLCEGWTTVDLAAHLVVRERRPDSGPGLVWPPLAGYTAKVRQAKRDNTDWESLVDTGRRGPPVLLRPFDRAMNRVEDFIQLENTG